MQPLLFKSCVSALKMVYQKETATRVWSHDLLILAHMQVYSRKGKSLKVEQLFGVHIFGIHVHAIQFLSYVWRNRKKKKKKTKIEIFMFDFLDSEKD